MDLAALKKNLSIEGELTDDNALVEITKAFASAAKASKLPEELCAALSLSTKLNDENVVAEVTKVFKAMEAKVANPAPKAGALEVHPELLRLSQSQGAMQLSQLTGLGKIDADCQKKLGELFLNDPALKLSLSSEGGNKVFDALIGILANNKQVPMNREGTGPQLTTQLSSGMANSDDDAMSKAMDRDVKRRQELRK